LPLFTTPGTTFIIDGQDRFPAAVASYIYQNVKNQPVTTDDLSVIISLL